MKVMTSIKCKAVFAVGTALLFTIAAVPDGFCAETQTKPDTDNVIPLIRLTDAPLGDAIRNLAHQAGLNCVLDPHVPGSTFGPGRLSSQPSVTAQIENVTAKAALLAVLKKHNLTLVTNPATTVARIAHSDLGIKPVPVADVGADSGQPIPLVVVEHAPVTNVVSNLARQAGLAVSFDSQVLTPAFADQGKVSIRWKKITARQALAAILDNYGLVMTENAAAATARISLKPKTDAERKEK